MDRHPPALLFTDPLDEALEEWGQLVTYDLLAAQKDGDKAAVEEFFLEKAQLVRMRKVFGWYNQDRNAETLL